MKKDYKVSIIVPMYKVEKYIKKCLESCLNQTYKNIEVIAIDDGSPDDSYSIARDMQKEYLNLKIVKKENGGVSSARNEGIEKSTGDFIVFVDGDDYLSPEYVEYMLKLITTTDSDFAFSKFCFTTANQNNSQDSIKVLNSYEATALLLDLKVIVGCWNKIYRKALLIDNNIRFSTDLFFGEGLEFILRCAQNSKAIVVGKKRVYYYRQNNMSSATTKFEYEKYVNGEKSLEIIRKEIKKCDDNVDKQWKLHYCVFCLNALIDIINNKRVIPKYRTTYKLWKNRIKKYKRDIMQNKKVEKKIKFKIFLVLYLPKVISFRDKIKRKKIIERSV